jgi:phosphatidylserine synthase
VDQHALMALLPLAVTVLVVFRFAFRELRERTVTSPGVWIRPAIIVVLTVYLVVLTAGIDGRDDGIMLMCLGVGALLGALTGLAIVRNTTFAPAEKKNAVRVRGSRVTLAIWIAALAVRLLARVLFPGGADPRAQLPLDCGTVALVAVAFIIIAAAFQREIGRHAPAVT